MADLLRLGRIRTWVRGRLVPASLLFLGCTLVGGPQGGPSSPEPPASDASEPPITLSPVAARPPPPQPMERVETGVASWYGEPFHGRQTSSGEVYDMNALTCAHPSLPFGTRLHVQNLDNGRATTLRINDRGPFAKGRILDVSRRAAEELGMIEPGTARVRITVLEPNGMDPGGTAPTWVAPAEIGSAGLEPSGVVPAVA